MSHNAKSYRKKITDKSAKGSKRIDLLFKQAILKESDDQVPGPSRDSNPETSDLDRNQPAVPSPTRPTSNLSESESEDDEPVPAPTVSEPSTTKDGRKINISLYESQHKWLYWSSVFFQ